MPFERNLTPKEARDYMEKMARKLLRISSEKEFWELLWERGQSFISSFSRGEEEEKEIIYRAVANRLYYGFFQFFRWYEWEGDEEDRLSREERVRRRTNHGSLHKEVAEKMARTLVRMFPGVFEEEEVRGNMFQWIDKLYRYRCRADYETETVFRDEDFQALLESYLCFRLVLAWL